MERNTILGKARVALAAAVAVLSGTERHKVAPKRGEWMRGEWMGWGMISHASTRGQAADKRAAKKKRNRIKHRTHVQASSKQGGAH